MSESVVHKIPIVIMAFVFLFIAGGFALTVISMMGIFPLISGFYSIVFFASIIGFIGGLFAFIFPKTTSTIMCILTLGSVDIDC